MSKMRHCTVITILILLLTSVGTYVLKANPEINTGAIKGAVTTSDNKPAAMVTVTLKGTKRVTLTTDDGSFILHNIKHGTYQLELSLVGYETTVQQVTVENNKTADVTLQLRVSDKELQEVIVKSGAKSYKTSITSNTLRIQTPILEAPQNIQVVTNKTLQDQQVISMSDGVVRNVSGAVRQEHWADMYTNIASRGSQIQAFRNGPLIICRPGPARCLVPVVWHGANCLTRKMLHSPIIPVKWPCGTR